MSITESAILGGRIHLQQATQGYRAGVDAILLAAGCDARADERVLDVGCGAGAVMLAAAAMRPGVRFVGLEMDADAVALARINIALNDMTARVSVVEGRVGLAFKELAIPPFDAVLSNPPFFDDPAALRAPAPAKRAAWLSAEGLHVWMSFLLASVRQGGAITVIHRADRLGDILAGLIPRAGSIQVRPISPFADTPAKRVIVRAIKTGKAPLRLLAPLVLHERAASTKYSADAEAILQGQSRLNWS